MKRILVLAVTLLAAACASPSSDPPSAAPAPAAALNPVGTYDFTTMDAGSEVKGTIEITGTPGAYTGRLRTANDDDVAISQVAVAGQVMTLVVNTPGGPLTFTLTFTGDAFTGNWVNEVANAAISGQRTQ
jgi:hypothetical protein